MSMWLLNRKFEISRKNEKGEKVRINTMGGHTPQTKNNNATKFMHFGGDFES